MSSKRQRKKSLQRAAGNGYMPGGATMVVPANYQQSQYGQTFYGSALKNSPSAWTAQFSPGVPLPSQPAVNPGGLPVQYKFPVAYNSFPVDRAMGNPDVPSFESLRKLARLYSGITMCERVWLDLVPRMTLKIALKPEAVAAGAEEKTYQKQMAYFQGFFEKPDGRQDYHTWIRKALREQTQIDELYIYKHRTRAGKLLGLRIIDGSQMKPLLDDWGMLPEPPTYAYQQYPWGIPGYQYTLDDFIHYQETPAVEDPYGFSRVERIIIKVNLALRKERLDLSRYTEGNIPQGIMEVPQALNWTPDQIDAYEQSWNALMAGNSQQQTRVKFVQPGMKYTPFPQVGPDGEFDSYLLNIAAGAYGLSMQDLAMTGDIHKSSGDSQQNVLYRRTIEPLAKKYAAILTEVLNNDFEPSLHGDLFVVTFTGFEESEDIGALASAYSMLTNAGILGISDAGKLLKLPEPKDAPYIGRIINAQNPPVFLDKAADPTMLQAAQDAQMAGYQMAKSNPTQPQNDPQEGDGDDEETGPTTASSKSGVPQQKAAQKNDQSAGTGGKGPTKERAVAASGQSRGSQTAAIQEYDTERALDKRPAMLQQHTGMMVAFMLDPETAQQIALSGGESAQDLHCTLAFLGDMGDEAQAGKLHPVQTLDNLKTILSAFAGGTAPVQGRIGGIGRFVNPDSDSTPIIAPVNAPGLQEWRDRLVSVLQAAGYHIANEFDFLPHITLSYIDDDAAMPIDTIAGNVYLNFDTLCLAIGDDRYYFPIGGNNEQRAQQDTKGKERSTRSLEGRNRQAASGEAEARVVQPATAGIDPKEVSAEYKRWRSRALDDIKAGRPQREFGSTIIPERVHTYITASLEWSATPDDVRTVFERARERFDEE